jgi:copper transport protein
MRRALVLVVGLWILSGATNASAHALLRDSTPADGEILDSPPSEVVIDFTEPPDLGLSEITVLDGNGENVGAGDLEELPGEGNRVRVTLPDVGEGVYTVSWRVLSRVDGHLTAGSFSFGVGVEAAALPAPAADGGGVVVQRPTPLSVAGRWAFYWGLALLFGGAVAGLVVFRRALPATTTLSLVAWVVTALGLAGMFLAERSAVGVSTGALLGSERGSILIVRAAVVAAVGLAVLYLLVRRSRPALVVVATATAAAMAVHAYAGHAGAAETWRWLKVGVQWVHIAAVAVWVGGLVWLLVGTWGRDSREKGMAVGRFSVIAGIALAAVAVTGAVRAFNGIGFSPGRLFDTGFGLTVVGKVLLSLGLVGLGAYNRYRVVPALASGQARLGTLRRTVGGEVALAAGIFGITGIMAGLAPPAQYGTAAAAQEGVTVTGSDFAETTRVELTATPGTAGPNTFQVRVEDFDSGDPLDARLVTLRFSNPERPEVGRSELELRLQDDAWVGQGTNLSVGGAWTIGVLVEQAADSIQIPVEIEARVPPQEIQVIEGGPGQPDLYMIQIGGGLSVQGYVDPGQAGANEVHFTFFDASGGEQAVEEARIEAIPGTGEPRTLEVRRLGEGHFVASAELEAGSWRFAVEASTADGDSLSAAFEEAIEG